jgi:hypothetical protein
MSNGVQFQGSFTWAKNEDTSSGSFAGDNFGGDLSPTIPWWDQKMSRGPSDFNIGRNLVINALSDIPTPVSPAGPVGWIAKGWELGGIVQLSNGVPIWPLDGVEGDPMGQLNSGPIAIPDVVSSPGCRSLVNPGNVNNHIKFNHPNFAPPVSNLEAFDATGAAVPGFGQITSTQTPGREIQFALKLIW